jgi:hypothetical protein
MEKTMNALVKAKKQTHDDVVSFLGAISNWPELQERNPKLARFAEAYVTMALRGAYRPGAPSDGFGHIQLTRDECNDHQRLAEEAVRYAVAFDKEEDVCKFNIGCSNFDTNRAFVLAIESARLLCGSFDGAGHALRLLKLAVEEVTEVMKGRRD